MSHARRNIKVLGFDPAYALRLRISNYCLKIIDTIIDTKLLNTI